MLLTLLAILAPIGTPNPDADERPNVLWITSEDNGPHLGCYGDDFAYFESAHGTAPDIAGQNVINPSANILTACMMLDYLGFTASATQLRDALVSVFSSTDIRTPDLGGTASTTDFCIAVRNALGDPSKTS